MGCETCVVVGLVDAMTPGSKPSNEAVRELVRHMRCGKSRRPNTCLAIRVFDEAVEVARFRSEVKIIAVLRKMEEPSRQIGCRTAS